MYVSVDGHRVYSLMMKEGHGQISYTTLIGVHSNMHLVYIVKCTYVYVCACDSVCECMSMNEMKCVYAKVSEHIHVYGHHQASALMAS